MVEYTELLDEFKKWLEKDDQSQKLWLKANLSKATYKDADRYASGIGKWWSEALTRSYGDADYSDAVSEIEKSLRKTYSESAYYAKNVQAGVNKRAKIGMKALEPAIDESRITNLIDKLVAEDASFLFDTRVIQNIAKSAVSDTVKANARIQKKAGLTTTMTRHVGAGGCCAWCRSVAGGPYEYGDQPADFFSYHDDCSCWIEYSTSKGTKIIDLG